MNAMGHNVKTFIGVRSAISRKRPQAGSRLHADGLGRHGRDGRDGNADARQHAADDDRLRSVRADGDGRHVLGREGARRAGAEDYSDPGPYRHPAGTVAYEVEGRCRRAAARRSETPRQRPDRPVTVVKPGAKAAIVIPSTLRRRKPNEKTSDMLTRSRCAVCVSPSRGRAIVPDRRPSRESRSVGRQDHHQAWPDQEARNGSGHDHGLQGPGPGHAQVVKAGDKVKFDAEAGERPVHRHEDRTGEALAASPASLPAAMFHWFYRSNVT